MSDIDSRILSVASSYAERHNDVERAKRHLASLRIELSAIGNSLLDTFADAGVTKIGLIGGSSIYLRRDRFPRVTDGNAEVALSYVSTLVSIGELPDAITPVKLNMRKIRSYHKAGDIEDDGLHNASGDLLIEFPVTYTICVRRGTG